MPWLIKCALKKLALNIFVNLLDINKEHHEQLNLKVWL